MSELFHVSSSPHVRAKDSTSRIMLYVIVALMPACLFGIYNFGWKALVLMLVGVGFSVLSEFLFNLITHKKNSIGDLSAVVTGLLLAMNVPVSLPLWQLAIGSVFAIIVVKMLFGGLGQNFMNPALGARCFLLLAFTANMTNFDCDAYVFIFGADPFNPTYVVAQLCGGGLMLGAFFMATDYVTSPITPKGQIIFGISCGLLTGIFRCFGANAEGVSYAIILSNLFVPLIERYTVPRAFGVVKEAKKHE